MLTNAYSGRIVRQEGEATVPGTIESHIIVDLQLTACRLAFHCPVADEPVVYELDSKWLPTI